MNELIKSIVDASNTQLEKLKKYYDILIEESNKYNLTAIKDLEEVYIKHFYDSLLLSKTTDLSKNVKLADIGSGAGFPGLVLKIMFPNLSITLIEPTLKRCNFLNLVIKELDLKDIYVVNARAEEYIKEKREYFDIVTARAVAPLNILLELSIPFLKQNGIFIAMKGSSASTELEDALNAYKVLNAKVTEEYTFNLPKDLGTRKIIKFTKLGKTKDIYPRLYAKIKKQPL